MMRDDNFPIRRWHVRKSSAKFFQLLAINTAIFPGESACSVHARDSNFGVPIERLEIGSRRARSYCLSGFAGSFDLSALALFANINVNDVTLFER
jgi:hypothetical protein